MPTYLLMTNQCDKTIAPKIEAQLHMIESDLHEPATLHIIEFPGQGQRNGKCLSGRVGMFPMQVS